MSKVSFGGGKSSRTTGPVTVNELFETEDFGAEEDEEEKQSENLNHEIILADIKAAERKGMKTRSASVHREGSKDTNDVMKREPPGTESKGKKKRKKQEGNLSLEESKKKNPWTVENSVHVTKQESKKRKRDTSAEPAKKKAKDGKTAQTLDVSKVLELGEDEEGFNLIANASKKQQDLIQRAFQSGGTEMQKMFDKEKEQLVDDELDMPEDAGALPGWGGWAGQGVKETRRQKTQKMKKQMKRVEEKEKLKKKRKDATLGHVIITEREDKKVRRYLTTTVPHPYKTMEQYEQALKMPLGRDWNSTNVHMESIRPAVEVTKGGYIKPLSVADAQFVKNERSVADQGSKKRKKKKKAAAAK